MALTFTDILHLTMLAGLLLLTFLGAGLYIRGFWLYFRTVAWLRRAEQARLRRRYKSSAIAAILRDPGLSAMKRQFLLSLLGLPLFALGGALFNVLQHVR